MVVPKKPDADIWLNGTTHVALPDKRPAILHTLPVYMHKMHSCMHNMHACMNNTHAYVYVHVCVYVIEYGRLGIVVHIC